MTFSSAAVQVVIDEAGRLRSRRITISASGVSEARPLGLLPPPLDRRYRDNITRAEFCRLACTLIAVQTGETLEDLMADADGSAPLFADTTDPYVAAAARLGVVTGKGTAPSPERPHYPGTGIFDLCGFEKGLWRPQSPGVLLLISR